MPAVLVDGENALDISRGAAEGPLDGVADDPFRGDAVQPREALRRVVVDRQDEAEVGRPAQPAGVFRERPLDGLLVAAKGSIAVADPEELSPLAFR